MLSLLTRLLLVVLLTVTLAGCSVIGGIFKAGFWTGLFLALVVVVIIVAIARR